MSNNLFTSSATAFGGREGHVKSSDGVIDIDLAMPGGPRAKELSNATIQNNFLRQVIQPI